MVVPCASGLLGLRTDGLQRRDAFFAARSDLSEQLLGGARVKRVSEEQLHHANVSQFKWHRLGAGEPVAQCSRAFARALVHPTPSVALRLIATGQQPDLLELRQAWVDLRRR